MHYLLGMVTLTIKLPESLKQLLELEARQSDRSVSAVIREAVGQQLQKSGKSTSLYDRTRDLCGSGGSGRPDLATNSDLFEGFGR